MKPAQYLAGVAGARALYVWLYQDAVGMLPPPQAGITSPLESRTSQRDVAKALGWTPGVVGKELARLVNYRWLRDTAMPRFLGQRDGATVYLMADLEAEQATGEVLLVSRVVLGLKAPTTTERTKTTTTTPDGRGTNRQWNPDDMTGRW